MTFGSGTINGTFNDDSLVGGSGFDLISGGGGGADSLEGGLGIDSMSGGNGGDDRYYFTAGDGADIVYDISTAGGWDAVVLSGITSVETHLVGESIVLVLKSGSIEVGSVRLLQNIGIYGSEFIGFATDNESAQDVSVEIDSRVEEVLGSVNLSLQGLTFLYDVAVGTNALGDTIIGGSDNDYIQGKNGDDSLSGGNGDDWLHGAEDDDTLVGGPGHDYLLVFRP